MVWSVTKYLHLALEFGVGFLFEEVFLKLGNFIPQAKYWEAALQREDIGSTERFSPFFLVPSAHERSSFRMMYTTSPGGTPAFPPGLFLYSPHPQGGFVIISYCFQLLWENLFYKLEWKTREIELITKECKWVILMIHLSIMKNWLNFHVVVCNGVKIIHVYMLTIFSLSRCSKEKLSFIFSDSQHYNISLICLTN